MVSSSDIWITGAIIFALLILSGIFSGSETALTAASKARLRALARDGHKRAKRVAALIEKKERLIGAILLGNNLVNILASALATGLFLDLVGENGVIYATLTMTAMVLIFAEVLPKTYAIARTETVALRMGPFIGLIVWLFAPVVGLVQRIVRMTLHIFGVNIDLDRDVLSAHEEIRGTIDLHTEEGGLRRVDQSMLGGVLDLNEVTVEDVMIHRSSMQSIDVSKPAGDIVTAIVRSPYTRLPVYDGEPDNIVGILHAKDVLRAMKRAGSQVERINIRRIMSKPWFVPETTTLNEQLAIFQERKAHFALVVDEYGDLQGLVTLEDIIEEIVGDITDEHDQDLPGLTRQSDGGMLVDGSLTIRDFNRHCRASLPDTEATTMAGLIIHEAEQIPIVGQRFSCYGFEFEITARQRNQITQMKVKRLPEH